MTEQPTSTPDEAPKPARRRASRAAGPSSTNGASIDTTMVTTVTARVESAAKQVVARPAGRPPHRRPNRRAVVLGAVAVLGVVAVTLGVLGGFLLVDKRHADAEAARDQRFVDTAEETVVNMFSYTQDDIDPSVNRFMAGISGPLRDMMSQNNNVENLKAIFRDTNASSEAVVNGAALEAVDQDAGNASVLVAVRVTVTDIDGVNKPSQAYRLRVIVHEDDNGRMTGYDLKYPDGGN